MKIISFATDNLAGITGRKYEFTDGINVLYGPNEAGKSTVIDGIYNVLFTPAKINRSTSFGKEFEKMYFNQSSDSINGMVEIEVEGEIYKIEKNWSKTNNYSEKLTLPDGSTLTDSKRIKEKLQEIFEFGSGTYKHLNFSSQNDPNDSLYNLTSDNNIKQDVSGYLNKTVMELDGLSLEKLEENINNKLKDLGDKWDFEANQPKNAKGIDDPYKSGKGRILEAYYEKEYLKRDKDIAFEKEKDLEEASQNLNAIEEEFDLVKKEKLSFDELSEDIRKRANLERDLDEFFAESVELRKAANDFPIIEKEYKLKKDEYDKKSVEINELKGKLAYIEKREELLGLEKIYEKHQDLANEILEIEAELEKYKNISLEQVNLLRDTERNIDLLKAKLSAGNIMAKIDILDEDAGVVFKDGLGNDIKDSASSSFFSLEVPEILDLKIMLGELDYDEISSSIKSYEKKSKDLYEALDIKTVAEGEEKLRLKNDLDQERSIKQSNQRNLLEGHSLESLDKKIRDLSSYTDDYNKESILQAIDEVNRESKELERLQVEYKLKYDTLIEKYQSISNVYDALEKVGAKKSQAEFRIQELAELPEGFLSTEDFFERKKEVDFKYNNLSQEYFHVKDNYNEALRNLPETTVENLELELREKEEQFDIYLKQYQGLRKIKEVYQATVEELSLNPMAGLEKSLNNYLKEITSGNIELNSIGDRISLSGRTSSDLAYSHLSEGSKDSVALALRLALVENIFSGPSFICFDDVLNDLDGERRKEAVGLLKKFSEDNQIIFTTCNEEIKNLLSGNVIEVGI